MTASTRQAPPALPDAIGIHLLAWRRRLAQIDLAARMGSPDADRRRRQVLAEVASALAIIPAREQPAILATVARELRIAPKFLAAAVAAQPKAEPAPEPDPGPSAPDAISDPLAALFESEARRRRRLEEIAAVRA